MNRVLAGLLVCLALIVGTVVVVLGFGDRSQPTETATQDPATRAEIERLSKELAALSERLARLERAGELARAPERLPTQAPVAAAPAELPATGIEGHDAQWYLDQYVLSFRDDEKGSELYRLHVDARAAELVDPICDLARDAGRPLLLRVSLVAMLGRARFQGDPAVARTLLDVLCANGPDRLGVAAIDALASAGGPGILPDLEAAVFAIANGQLRTRAIQVALRIAGEGSNALILRLLARAPDDGACELLAFLDGADPESALLAFRSAAGRSQPLRLCGAQKIGEFAEPPFAAFVEEWLSFETDPQVIAVLRGALQRQKTVPAWDARQAIGPPDAHASRDDPKAWASAEGDMGMQWLELDYANPMPASAVRIHEVNVPGAVAEVAARSPAGHWTSLWSGTARSKSGEALQIDFATTSFAVRTLRVILDTSRAPDWNEIDAVELLGPAGRQWASGARASSNYGAGSRLAREARIQRR